MRVLLIFSSSELGGAERSLTRMALASTGEIEYTLATLDGPGPWVEWCRELGAKPLVLGERRATGEHGRFGFKALLRLMALVRRKRYSVLYVIGLRASLWLRLMRPWLRGARIVHGIRWNPDSNSPLDRAFRLVEQVFGGLVGLYICNSRIAADTLERRVGIPQDKIRAVYNGLNHLPPPPDTLTDRPLNVVVVANLSPRRGQIEFLDVVTSVVRSLPQAHFDFVGRDDMGGRVEEEIAHRGLSHAVTVTGYQSDVSAWLQKAVLMVLPSLWGEGCPTSILEGFAHGLPVVAYSIDGMPELISDGVDGYLVPPRDTARLARAILQVLEDPALAARMGAAGRAKVEHYFTLARCASQHAAAFSELSTP